MNAYELAKYIEDDIQIQEGIADMLRQQAERIAELEKKELNAGGEPVKNATYWKRQHDKLADRIAELEKEKEELKSSPFDSADDSTNVSKNSITQPYAYAVVQGENGKENVSLQFDHPEMCGQEYKQAIPLYTTPQTKPLTDEEIWNWFKENTALTKESALRIARAILRKAQEK